MDKNTHKSQEVDKPQEKETKKEETKATKTQKNTQQAQTDCQVLEIKIKELEDKLNEQNDRYLRLAAEYDNYRKRTLKEKSDLIKTAGEKVLVDLLPVIDDFDLALEHIDKASDVEALKEGVKLIYNHFQKFLTQQGVEEIEALGKPLDTDLHEAIQQMPAQSDEEKGKIVKVVQKGYKLNDKVIRHAKVIVAM